MAFVTDPEELRTRAASIFERLRTSSGSHEEMVADDADGDLFDDEEIAPPATEADAAVGVDIDEPGTENESPLDAGRGRSQPVISTDHRNRRPRRRGRWAPVRPARGGGSRSAQRSDQSPHALHPAAPTSAGPDDELVETKPSAPTRRALPRILAIANQKGGVGKTTTAVNLGASLAELGYRVLVVDLDPQGNATTGLGINARNLDASVYDVLLHDVPVVDCIEPSSLRNLFVVPATIDLAGAEIELVPVFSRELRLKRALEQLGDDFDFTLIDCPPSLGLLTVNGLAAAGEVVVPIQCEYYALEGLGQLLRNVNLVQSNLNPSLEVSTIILTMYDARTRLAEQVVAEVTEALRRSCLPQRGASHRATLRGTIVRSAHHCV